jgi:deazaflavin-dependent oxidoreductase (nitroreductase family)
LMCEMSLKDICFIYVWLGLGVCSGVSKIGPFCNSSISLHNSDYRARARDGLSARNVRITPAGQMTVHTFLSQGGRALSLTSAGIRWILVPNQTIHPSFFITTICGGHDDNVSTSTHEKETMSKTAQAPWFARWGNMLTTPLLRAGVKLVGPGHYPMYLLTVRGRTSGQPRTVPIVLLEQNGQRYLAATYGSVHWVRNLRVAREAILTRGRRAETVTARELPKREAALVLQAEVMRTPIARAMAGRFYGVTPDTPLEQVERTMLTHPVFVLESKEHGNL